MDDTNPKITGEVLLGQLRTALAAIGGAFVANGAISADTLNMVLGIAMTLIPLAWSAWSKFQSERKTKAREAVAVNVGIAVADRTVGVTPPVPVANAPAVIEAFKPVSSPTRDGAPNPTGLTITPESPVLPVVPSQP